MNVGHIILICYSVSIINQLMEELIEVEVGRLLKKSGMRLAIAESCTGGLISHRITNVPGSSEYYVGSIVAYSYDAKIDLLKVPWDILEKYGAVSQKTVLEMAQNIRKILNADVSLSISGIAGPSGGTNEKPVGLVWIGLSSIKVEKAWRYIFNGERLQIKEQAAETALKLLVKFLGDLTTSNST